ncbi:hypothetical protein [Tenacibaculum sp. SG-28]|uniref:hypothetical protein n=1 Tax=Tenacibaculum sp. SG-28 TaxID=754426 RepID=UPI000CF40C1C|nr:hypothetical protein [Tenacibaculum sp. SG-28]PQJ21644.1 hypothetical protein BSU00_05995 [Tenacibaculum sp. SG-28]
MGYTQTDTPKFDKLVYKIKARGSFSQLTVFPDKIIYVNGDSYKNHPITANDYQELSDLLNEIDASKIPSFKAPTNERARDKAMQANVSVYLRDSTYSSQAFDAGAPPVPLQKLLEKVFELSRQN